MANNTVGYMPSPSCTRGTAEIGWSCLTTIAVCVWTVLHINVAPKSPIKNKIRHCIQCMLGPEAYAAHAIKRLAECWMLRKTMRREAGWEKWTLKQSFIVRMGGIRMSRNPDTELGEMQVGDSTSSTRSSSATKSSKTKTMMAATLVNASKMGLQFEDFPDNDKIDKRSKTDWFGKTIAIFQVAWFAANFITRLVRNYDVSVIELITAAFVFCGIIMYCCQLWCPQDVQEPWVLDVTTTDEEWARMPRNNTESMDGRLFVWRGTFYVAVTMLSMFVAVHLLAWNYPFPSLVESWLWRSACMVLSSGVVYLYSIYVSDRSRASSKLTFVADKIVTPLYCLARVTLAALAVASLRQAPKGIYESVSWLTYLGHWGS